MQLSRQETRGVYLRERKKERIQFWTAVAVFLVSLLFCLSFRYNAYYYSDWFVPKKNFQSLLLGARILFSRFTGGVLWTDRVRVIENFGSIEFWGALARLKIELMAFVSGGALAIAGAIFQTAYRNPMASPNIIGASAGVGLGNVVVVMLYSAAAYEHIFLRYKFCYGFTVVIVGLILLISRVTGSKGQEHSVMEMVMAGSIVTQALGMFRMYVMYNLEDEDLVLFQEINMGTNIQTDAASILVFFIVMAIALLPVLLLRYRLNTLGMSRMENAALGIQEGPLRLIAQVCGVLMVTCAMIHCGEMGMVTMVVPYVVRHLIGSDFRKLCVFSLFAGGVLMMFCRLATSFIVLAGQLLPVTFIVNMALMPAFMVIIAKQKGRDSFET